jgi:hypothetical protein
VCGCVFAAIAGPAVSLHLRTEALHQALNRSGPLGTAIEVNASWNTFTAGFTNQSALAEDDLSTATSTGRPRGRNQPVTPPGSHRPASGAVTG